jgi:ParB family transcriptional regulator, chromosome partitioning protein
MNTEKTLTTPTPKPIELKHIPFLELKLAPNPRPRESISAESIQEIADSVLQHGIIQPVLTRINPEGQAEVYAGQRRFLGFERALEMVKAGEAEALVSLDTVPCVVRDIDDRTMREQQWIENLQRENVHPRDEANGYAELRDVYGYTAASIAVRIGKVESYVRERMSLVKLPDVYWKAWDAKKLTISHLEVAGGVRGVSNQEEFARRIMGGEYDTVPMTVREAQELKNKEFMKSLRACGFDKDDEDLLKVEHVKGERVRGGACKGCPFKVGSEKAPQCENVACFAAKQDATWHQVKVNAEENGRRIMDVDQTAALFDGVGDLIMYRGWVDLGARPGYLETGHYNEDVPTWEDLLHGTQAFANAVMARHPKTNRIVQLLERAEAIRMAEEADEGNAKIFEKRPGAPRVKTGGVGDLGTGGEGDEETGGLGDEETRRQGAEQRAEAELNRKIRPALEARLIQDVGEALMQRGVTEQARDALVKLVFWQVAESGDAGDLLTSVFGNDVERAYYTPEEAWEIVKDEIAGDVNNTGVGWVKWIAMLILHGEFGLTGHLGDGDQPRVNKLLSAVGVDRSTVKEQVIQGIKAKEELKEEPKPTEKMVSCDKCGIGNFTKRGLKAHKCRDDWKRNYAESSVPDWVATLLEAEVKEELPNANDVYEKPLICALVIDRKTTVDIRLSCDATLKQWSAGYGYTAKDRSGGGLPQVVGLKLTRAFAVEDELESLLKHFGLMASPVAPSVAAILKSLEEALQLVKERILSEGPGEEETGEQGDRETQKDPMVLSRRKGITDPDMEEKGRNAGKVFEQPIGKHGDGELERELAKVEITEEIKAKARTLYDEGMGKGQIAKELGISENTVGNWQKRHWPKRGAKAAKK